MASRVSRSSRSRISRTPRPRRSSSRMVTTPAIPPSGPCNDRSRKANAVRVGVSVRAARTPRPERFGKSGEIQRMSARSSCVMSRPMSYWIGPSGQVRTPPPDIRELARAPDSTAKIRLSPLTWIRPRMCRMSTAGSLRIAASESMSTVRGRRSGILAHTFGSRVVTWETVMIRRRPSGACSMTRPGLACSRANSARPASLLGSAEGDQGTEMRTSPFTICRSRNWTNGEGPPGGPSPNRSTSS